MFLYFGYGSNLNATSLKAKGVVPLSSEIAILRGWKLGFNVHHWFRHEGGVGNILPDPDGEVHGLVHLCQDEHLPLLDAVESYGVGYDRIDVYVETENGSKQAVAYVGLPGYLDSSCLPTRRYMNLIIDGAVKAGLDEAYIQKLKNQPLFPEQKYPPFQPPINGETVPVFDSHSLAQHPFYTALLDAVFDMEDAREKLHCLHSLFGGKDMTLFHLRRHDSSRGDETLDDILHGHIAEEGRQYLNAYLHEYQREFRYVGRYQIKKKEE